MRIDEQTGEVRSRAVLEKRRLGRRYRVKEKPVERPDRIDSRFDVRRARVKWSTFSPRKIGVLYLWAIIWAVFALWVPDTWLTWDTHRDVLNTQAVLFIVALGLLVPLAAGVFDLSIGATVTAGAVTVSWALTNQQWSLWRSIGLALLCGVVIGVVNGLLVVWLKVDSFIATLGTSSIITAYVVWLSDNKSFFTLPQELRDLTSVFALGMRRTVLYALILALVLWFVLEHTAVGRYLFATGGGREAARLAGVQTDRYVFAALITSAVLSAAAGVLVASQFGSTNTTIGVQYLLPAFAAGFFGATQFKSRFNVWGTVLAVYVLQEGVKGLQLAQISQPWVDDLFFGVALVAAVALSTYRRKTYGGQRRWWRRSESGPEYFLGRVFGWGRPKTEASKRNAQEWWFDPEDREGHHLEP